MAKYNRVVVRTRYRFGNNLSNVATGLTLSVKMRVPMVICPEDGPCAFGSDAASESNIEYMERFRKTLFKEFPYIAASEIASDDWVVQGMECRQLFDKKLVRDRIRIPDEFRTLVYSLYGNLDDFAAVNVRRGDYVTLNEAGITQFVVLSREFYKNAMRNHFSADQKFLVVSDDIPWCRKNFGDSVCYADKHSTDEKILTDFAILTMCKKGLIESCSTFSWWGGIMNEGDRPIIVFPHSEGGVDWDSERYFYYPGLELETIIREPFSIAREP